MSLGNLEKKFFFVALKSDSLLSQVDEHSHIASNPEADNFLVVAFPPAQLVTLFR